ncbi:MAG TPA: histidine phosphatase family protein [Pyrinomonadaceae bacterium]|jgi:broad specificity phosphatase PhoE
MDDAFAKTVAFIRHGETPLHVGANRFCGDLDPELTAKGREQAARAGLLLPHIMPKVDAAWTSPRLRARLTASIVLPHADWQVFEDVRELAFGEWEGLTKEEAAARTPDAYRAWEEDAYRNGPPGGESGLRAQPRIDSLIDQITSTPAEHILLVSHITYLRLLIALLLEIPLSEARKRLDVQQGTIGLLEISARKARLTALNLRMIK